MKKIPSLFYSYCYLRHNEEKIIENFKKNQRNKKTSDKKTRISSAKFSKSKKKKQNTLCVQEIDYNLNYKKDMGSERQNW